MKAYILITLTSGENIKYIHPDHTPYWEYTNEVGDKFENQTSAGQVKHSFDNLIAQINGTGAINFPGVGTILSNHNQGYYEESPMKVFSSFSQKEIASIKAVEV